MTSVNPETTSEDDIVQILKNFIFLKVQELSSK